MIFMDNIFVYDIMHMFISWLNTLTLCAVSHKWILQNVATTIRLQLCQMCQTWMKLLGNKQSVVDRQSVVLFRQVIRS